MIPARVPRRNPTQSTQNASPLALGVLELAMPRQRVNSGEIYKTGAFGSMVHWLCSPGNIGGGEEQSELEAPG